MVFVFNGLGTVSRAILLYRIGEKSFLRALFEELAWTPMFVVFFGGLSFHLNLSILAHMFSIDMQWGATAKEKENSNFFKEVPKIFSTFRWMYLVCIPIIGGMIYLGAFAPYGYEINTSKSLSLRLLMFVTPDVLEYPGCVITTRSSLETPC